MDPDLLKVKSFVKHKNVLLFVALSYSVSVNMFNFLLLPPLLTYHPCLFLFISFLWFVFLLTPSFTLKLTWKPISTQRAVHFPIATHLQLTSIGLSLLFCDMELIFCYLLFVISDHHAPSADLDWVVFDRRLFCPLFTMSLTDFFRPLTELFRFRLFAREVVQTREGKITNSKYLHFSEWTPFVQVQKFYRDDFLR